MATPHILSQSRRVGRGCLRLVGWASVAVCRGGCVCGGSARSGGAFVFSRSAFDSDSVARSKATCTISRM